jgi:hypothetical protein
MAQDKFGQTPLSLAKHAGKPLLSYWIHTAFHKHGLLRK